MDSFTCTSEADVYHLITSERAWVVSDLTISVTKMFYLPGSPRDIEEWHRGRIEFLTGYMIREGLRRIMPIRRALSISARINDIQDCLLCIDQLALYKSVWISCNLKILPVHKSTQRRVNIRHG
jgi:hypothetical protein